MVNKFDIFIKFLEKYLCSMFYIIIIIIIIRFDITFDSIKKKIYNLIYKKKYHIISYPIINDSIGIYEFDDEYETFDDK
jgi:hypothetical protein